MAVPLLLQSCYSGKQKATIVVIRNLFQNTDRSPFVFHQWPSVFLSVRRNAIPPWPVQCQHLLTIHTRIITSERVNAKPFSVGVQAKAALKLRPSINFLTLTAFSTTNAATTTKYICKIVVKIMKRNFHNTITLPKASKMAKNTVLCDWSMLKCYWSIRTSTITFVLLYVIGCCCLFSKHSPLTNYKA